MHMQVDGQVEHRAVIGTGGQRDVSDPGVDTSARR
jgi:hypothetical protein